MADSSDPLTCYTIGLNFVTSSNQYFPCGGNGDGGGAQSCCYAGDYCMEDSICHYTHAVTNGTGYYMAGCTDPTWQDPACPKACTSEFGADVIYDTTNEQWNCCVSEEGYLNCQQPSDFTVQAPGPQSLSTLTQLNTPAPSASLTQIGSISSYLGTISSPPESASASSSSPSFVPTSDSPAETVTPKALANPTSDPSSSASSSSDSGLSGGAIAGIVVGVIALLTLIAVGALLLRRRNKRKSAAIATPGEKRDDAPSSSEMAYHEHRGEGGVAPGYGAGWDQGQSGAGMYGAETGQYHELSSPEKATHVPPQELPGSAEQKPVELAGEGTWKQGGR